MSSLAVVVYRLMERIDGEKGKVYLPYRFAQLVKLWCLGRIK